MDTKYYRVIVACGHVGSGKSLEISRYFKAYDSIECYISAFWMPRSKKTNDCIKLVQQVSVDEYKLGKKCEKYNPYLQFRKSQVGVS